MFRRRIVDVSPGYALRRLPILVALLACAAQPVSSPARAAAEVGVAASVRPSTLGTPPVSDTRVLEVGDRLLFEERIETNRHGSTQVLFLDGTTLSIGQSSRVTLDAFVYDPDGRTGDLALSILEGVVRFIGGRISKLNPVKIRTPRAEIGIRGGIAIIEATARESTVSFLFGDELTVTPLDAQGRIGGEILRLRTPGFQVRVRDGAVSEPAPVVSGTVTDTIAVDTSEETAVGEDGDANAASIDRLAKERMGPEGAERSADAFAPPVVDARASAAPAAPAKVELESLQREGAQERLAARPSQEELAAKRYDGNYRRVAAAAAANGFAPLDAERLAAGDRGFSGARREDGRLLLAITENGEERQLDLPAASWDEGGELAFVDVVQPDGSRVSGTGYWDPLGQYFRYEGTRTFTGDDGRRATERIFLFGGERYRVEEFEPGRGSRLEAFELRPDPALGGTLPFLRAEDGGRLTNAHVSAFYALTRPRDGSGAIIDDASWSTGGVAALAIEGQGANQRSALSMATLSTYRTSGGVLRRTGAIRGTSRTAADSGPRRVASSAGTVPGGAGAYAGGAHVLGAVNGDPNRGSLFFVLDNYALDEPQSYPPGRAWSGEFDLATGFERWESYSFTHAATRIDTPRGVGERRSTRILNGYAAGLYESVVYPGPGESPFVDPVSVANRNDRPEDVRIDFRAERNRLRATFHLKSTGRYDAPNRENDFKPGTEFANLDIVVGTLHRDESPHRSVFVDDDRFLARDARNPGGYESRVHSLVDGEAPAHEGTYLVSSGLVPLDAFLPPGAAWCDCRYTEWGWWGGELANAADTAQYRSHLATFVAGLLPGSSDIPASGSASYSGHLVGPVTNGGEMYLAAGAFEKTWNFATRSGDVTVSDFDGADYAGTLTSAAGRDFAGPIASTTAALAGRGGDLAGSFFRAGSDPAGEVGGRFRIEDPANGYGATGIFQAAKARP